MDDTIQPVTFEQLVAEYQPLHNNICVLHDMKLVRLLGLYEDADDYYYIVSELGTGKTIASCVGHLISLKGIYPDDRYLQMERVFALNNAPPTETFEQMQFVSGENRPFHTVGVTNKDS